MTIDPDTPWKRVTSAFRHAFHVQPPGPATPSPEEAAIVERIVQEIVRRRMSGAALVFLESSRPLSGIGAAAMHFLQPFATAVIKPGLWSLLTRFLERAGAVEYLCLRIEALEQEAMGAVEHSAHSADPPSDNGPEHHGPDCN
jgi:hypothetical protein